MGSAPILLDVSFPALTMSWCFMILLLLDCFVSSIFLMVMILTVNHFAEGRESVKPNRVRSVSNSDRRLPNACRYALNARRSVSIRYETLRTGAKLTGEDFQNRGTFIVVRSSVFVKSSAQNTHLARDAYNAYSRRASGCQERNSSPELPEERMNEMAVIGQCL